MQFVFLWRANYQTKNKIQNQYFYDLFYKKNVKIGRKHYVFHTESRFVMKKLLISHFIRCKSSLDRHRSVNIYEGNEDVIPFRYFSICLILAAITVPLAYILYTGHIWEDFFITFKFSRNLAEGRGLVYEDGVKVHGFTSPLGTLLPSLCYLISGKSSYLSAIWGYRLLFCIPAFVLAVLYLMKIMSLCSACTRIHIFFAAIFFLVETKSVIYSVNGMETAFMLLFILMAFYYMNKDMRSKWFLSGISCKIGVRLPQRTKEETKSVPLSDNNENEK